MVADADATEAAVAPDEGGFALVVVVVVVVAADAEMLPSVAVLPAMALFVWIESDMVLFRGCRYALRLMSVIFVCS